jgi:hypothetical protein
MQAGCIPDLYIPHIFVWRVDFYILQLVRSYASIDWKMMSKAKKQGRFLALGNLVPTGLDVD